VVVGVLAAIPLAGQSKGIDFVVSDSGTNVSVTGSPIDDTVDPGWPVDYRALACETPEDLSGFSVQRIICPEYESAYMTHLQHSPSPCGWCPQLGLRTARWLRVLTKVSGSNNGAEPEARH
jgi:hypothetical protein